MSSRPLTNLTGPDLQASSKELNVLRSRLLQTILISAVILGAIALFLVIYTMVPLQLYWLPAIYTVAYSFLLYITFNKKLSATIRSMGFLLILLALSVSVMLGSGFSTSTGLLFLIAFVVLAAMFINRWVATIALFLGMTTVVATLLGTQAGWLPIQQLDLTSVATKFSQMILNVVIFAAISFMLSNSLSVILIGLNKTLASQKQLSDDLVLERSSLEQRVNERTAELSNRASQQQAAAQVAKAISTQTNLDDILKIAIAEIQNHFGFYHAGIFLIDENREYAVLRAATSEGGRQMIANNHRLLVGQEGIVGYVTSRGEARIAVDVGLDATHFQNPYLPDTHSEIALPLRTSAGVIGALDVQSREETAFSKDDLDVLQTIADQLASAIEHSRQLDALQKRVEELDASYRKLTKKSWQDFTAQTRRNLAYQMSRNDSQPVPIPVTPTRHARAALQSGQSIVEKKGGTAEDQDQALIAIPVKLREEVIGVIQVAFNTPNISQDTRDMLETTASRLAVALENVRLLDEVQTRAEREHLVSDLSTKIRSTSEIDHILRTTAEELGRILGASQVAVQLRTNQSSAGLVEE